MGKVYNGMNQREFWDWFHKEFSKIVSEILYNHCKPVCDEEAWFAAIRYTDILEQCRTLFNYEGTCYSYMNFKCILEGWAKDEFTPNLLQWVENDMKKRGCWEGRIEE